jgi:hypothetical protein
VDVGRGAANRNERGSLGAGDLISGTFFGGSGGGVGGRWTSPIARVVAAAVGSSEFIIDPLSDCHASQVSFL